MLGDARVRLKILYKTADGLVVDGRGLLSKDRIRENKLNIVGAVGTKCN